MARGMHKGYRKDQDEKTTLLARLKDWQQINPSSVKTQFHEPGSNKK